MTAIHLTCEDPASPPPAEYLDIMAWLGSLPPLSVVKVRLDNRVTDCWGRGRHRRAGACPCHPGSVRCGDGVSERAEGGSVNPGETYLVGERGPELFAPGTAGGITPNSFLAGPITRPAPKDRERITRFWHSFAPQSRYYRRHWLLRLIDRLLGRTAWYMDQRGHIHSRRPPR